MDTDTKFENQIRRAVCDESVSDLLLMCRTRSNKTELLSFKRNGKGLVHFAAIFGSVSLIERLMVLGIDVKTKTEGQSANENVLHLACKHGKNEVVTFLLRLVSDLSFRNAVVLHGDNYRNAFYYAAQSGNIEIVNILKDMGRMNLNEVFPNNKTVLLNLIEEDNIEALKMLCQCGANVNIGYFEKRLHAIHFAAEKKDGGELLRLVLTHGAYVNKPWGNQQPLFIAVKHGLVKNAKVLLEAGANVHSKGTSAKMGLISCFCLAALKCPSLIPEFLSKGANPNELHDRNGDSVLTLAIKNNASNEATSALLKAGANLDNAFQDETAKHMFPDDMITSLLDTGVSAHEIETKHKISLLILAMKGNGQTNRKAVSDLLLRGANPNIFPEGQDSPLVVAVEHGHPDIVDILIKAGAKINHIGKMGDAAIHVCCKQDTESKWQILKKLAAERTTLNMTNQHGHYPLELVMKNCSPARTNISRKGYTSCNLLFGRLRNRHLEIENCISDMLEKGANPNCTDPGRDSPLILAIKKNIENVVLSLLNAGADVSHIGEDGVTVLQVCINQRSSETIVIAVVEKGLTGNTPQSLGQFPLARLLDEGFSDSLLTVMIENGANPNFVQHGEDSVLMKAIKEKRYTLCRILIEDGANVNFKNPEGLTAFDIFTGHCRQHQVTSALTNHRDEQDLSLEDVLQSFMEFGIDVNQKSQSGACPLLVAVWLESLDMVRLIIEKGANVNIMDENDDTPLTFALMNGLDDIVDILLVSNANVNPRACKSSNQNQNNKTLEDNFQKEPILTRIIRDEKTLSDKKKNKYVKLLLDRGADSNITDPGKTSSLMYAVELRMEQTVENLLEHDADVNYVGKDNFTALHTYFINVGESRSRHMTQWNVPRKKQSYSILLMLLDAGGSTSMLTKFNELPIHIALKSESISEAHFIDVNLLLKRCKTIETSHINSLLQMATRFYPFEIIDKIITLGADVNIKNGNGDTALHSYMGCLDFDLEVVSTMLQHGAMVNVLNNSMETPLMRYIMRGPIDVLTEHVVFMIENGADVNICGDRRNSVLMLAITNDIPEIVETLIKAKANVNHIGENGNTALHLVLAKGKWDQCDTMETSSGGSHYSSMYPTARKSPFVIDARSKYKGLKTVKLLLNDGADLNVVNDYKETPLYIMIKCHDRSSVHMLLPIMLKGANPNLGEAVPLVNAAKRNFDAVVKSLLDQGAEIDKKNQHGDSALMATLKTPNCYKQDFSKTIKILLMAGASANQTDRTGMTPIEAIIRSQNLLETSYYVSKTDKDLCSKVSLLLEHGANQNIKESDQDSFLILAVERLLPLVVAKLLEYGANVNHTGQFKRTALHKVLLAETKYSSTVRHEALQIIDALLASQASVDIVDKEGNTPLLIAIQRESVDAVERLLKSAPNLSYQGKNKCNAYDMSLLCKSGPLKILNALLEHKNIGEKVGLFFMKFWEFIQKEKCRDKQLIEKIMLKIVCEKNLNVNIANRLKDSPLIYFTKLRSIDVVKLFIKMKADVNHVGEKGMTALHHAVMDTKTAIPLLDCLLKEHPLLDIKDQDQETPLTKVFKHLNKGYFYERDEFTEVCYILRRLLDAGAFSSQDDLNKALVTVAKKGDFVTMKSLVCHGANKHVLDNHSNTVLHLCWCEDLDGAVDFIRYYKEQGGKLDSLNEEGNSPLISLLKEDVNDKDKVKTRDREIDKITLCFLEFNSMVCVIPNKKGNSALHCAAKHGYIKTMETLLTHGCNPFSRNDVGHTPLHEALTSPKPNIVEVVTRLLKDNSLLFGLNGSGKSSLYLATEMGRNRYHYGKGLEKESNSQVVQLLLKYGENPNQHQEYTPLVLAIEEGDVSTTNLLLNAGANVNVVNKDEKTCLHILFTRNFDTEKVLSFVNLLLEKGINLNTVDKNKRSALFLAVQNCKERTTSYMMSGKRGEDPKKIVSKLIRHGANVNICDTSGETVLSMFCEQGSNIEIGELLLNSSADPSKGYCIQHVMENRRFSVNNSECINFIRRLLRKGADANKFKNGKSNVIEATKKGYRLLVEKMIKYGADVNFYDSTHQIALHHACGLEKSKGRDDLVHLLVRHGSKLNVVSTRGEKAIDMLLNKILEENGTIEDDESNGCSRLEYDMKLFNYLVRAGCYLLPSSASKTQISKAQGRAETGAKKSLLLTLINTGLFKTAEYLILSGWNIEQEVWFNNFDVSSLKLSDVEIKYSKRKQRDVEIRKSEFKAFLDGLDKGPKSLSILCRKSIRQQLMLAAEDSEIESRVNLLPIPAKMKCFLGLTDYAQDKEVIQLELNRSVRQHTSVSSDLVQAFLLSRIQSGQRHSLFRYYDSDDDYEDYSMYDNYYDNW